MNVLFRLYMASRGSGWFVPSRTGGLFPFPFAWQGWALFAGFLLSLAATIRLSEETGWICRLALCTGYIGVGMLSYAGD